MLFTSAEAAPYFFVFFTYIIADKVRMVFLNAVVEDSHHYTSSCVALSPRYFGIQVLMCWAGLKETQGFCWAVNLLWLTLPRHTNRKGPSARGWLKSSAETFTHCTKLDLKVEMCNTNINTNIHNRRSKVVHGHLKSNFNASSQRACLLRLSCLVWASYTVVTLSEEKTTCSRSEISVRAFAALVEETASLKGRGRRQTNSEW